MITFLKSFVYLSLILIMLPSCSKLNRARAQKKDLCSNRVVSNYWAVYTNRDVVAGKEVMFCEKNELGDVEADDEISLEREARSIFFEVCKSDILYSARLTLKGKRIGIVKRDCFRKTEKQ